MEECRFKVAIIGLGLMGGSLAYALRGFKNCVRTGCDIDANSVRAALEAGAADAAAASPEDAAHDADIVLLCSDLESTRANAARCLPVMKQGAVLCEICGVKEALQGFIMALKPAGVHYVGLHPMAGKERGGFTNADGALFRGAGFIVVPPEGCASAAVELITDMSRYVGAGRVCVNDAARHDAIIAYTSDLMHIAAAALTVRYPGDMTLAHAAGALRDVTRIADIDARLWASLLSANARHILPHLDAYIDTLGQFRRALCEDDGALLYGLLDTAGRNKRRMNTL